MLINTLIIQLVLLLVIDVGAVPRSDSQGLKRRQCKAKNAGGSSVIQPSSTPPVLSQPSNTQPAISQASPSQPPADQTTDSSGNATIAAGGGATVGSPLKASFTRYGSQDGNGSPNCATSGGSCGGPTGRGPPAGYTAAVSQNLYDGPAVGAPGKACYKCYQLEFNGKSIVVTVSNLCPADAGNPWCTMSGLDGPPNAEGGNVNFDLCDDTGARAALLGDAVVGLGTATELASCPGNVQTS